MPKKALALIILLLASLVPASILFADAAQLSIASGVLAHELTSSQAQALEQSSINWVSADVTVGDSDSSWTNIYNLAKQYNLNLIGILDTITMNHNPNFTLEDWNQTVLQALSKYGDKVKVWEIWNEPTYSQSVLGYQDGSPQHYMDMLQVAYSIIKAYSSSSIVLGLGGLPLYTGGDPTLLNQAISWTQQVANLGGMEYCDAIALHAYPYHKYDATVENAFTSSLQSYRNITGKEVWITEVGIQSAEPINNLTMKDQVDFLNNSYQLLFQEGVKAYIWYELNDNTTSRPLDPEYFGLFDESLAPKPAFETYTNLVNATPTPTPTPDETTTPTPIPELSILAIIALLITITSVIAGLKKYQNRNHRTETS